MSKESKLEIKEKIVVQPESVEIKKQQPTAPDSKSVEKTIPSSTKGDAIHYFTEAKVVCACGNNFTTGSTKEEIRVEICSSCHPFFTGKEKFVDTEGRVERFKRLEVAKKETKVKKEVKHKPDQPKTLKEMLLSMSEK